MRATRLPRHPGSRITLVAKPRISEAELRALARERRAEQRRRAMLARFGGRPIR